jgi:hypothetical protein
VPTFDLTDAEKRAITRAQDRYRDDQQAASLAFAAETAQALQDFEKAGQVARSRYQEALADLAADRGIEWSKVKKYEVDKVKGTAAFTVVEEPVK